MIHVEYGKPKKLGGRQSIYLTFPYNQDIVNVIRCVQERCWDSKNLVWELDYKALDFLKSRLVHEDFEIIGEPIDTGSLIKKNLKKYDVPVALKTDLFQYQLDDYNTLMNYDKQLVLHDTGLGKAQPMYSKILTPTGFVCMAVMEVGAEVLGEDGKPYHVLGIYPQGIRDIFELEFSDGSQCRCSDNHLWTFKVKYHEDVYDVITMSLRDIMAQGLHKTQRLWLPDVSFLVNIKLRYLKNITYIGKEECQCIYIDNPTHLYLTDDFIPTHNTIICSCVAQKRREMGLVDYILILCLNTLTVNWYKELQKHFDIEATILGAKKDKKGNFFVKSNKDKLKDLKTLPTTFLITNIESLQYKPIVQEISNLCKKKNVMIIEDEIHRGVSNPGTRQGSAFLRLHPKYCLGLSGTLLTNSALNLYVPLKFVDGFKGNFTAFKSHFVVYGGYGGYQVVGYKNLAELQLLVDMFSIKRKKEDELDLPDITFKTEYLHMGKAQQKIYSEVLEQTLREVDKISNSINPLSMLIRLRQCTASTSLVSSIIHESIKLDRMEEIIEDIVSRNEKIVIFSNWTQVLNIAKERVHYDFALVTGEVKNKQSELEKFEKYANCKVLLATIGAAGTGLTLTAANTLLFLDSPWNYATFVQVSSRIYRIGQTRKCNIISLVAFNTIDERILSIVNKKKKLGDAVVNGMYDLKDRKVLEWLLEN